VLCRDGHLIDSVCWRTASLPRARFAALALSVNKASNPSASASIVFGHRIPPPGIPDDLDERATIDWTTSTRWP
jgi:hypothetical protein